MPEFFFLTNYAKTLFLIAHDLRIRMEDNALRLGDHTDLTTRCLLVRALTQASEMRTTMLTAHVCSACFAQGSQRKEEEKLRRYSEPVVVKIVVKA